MKRRRVYIARYWNAKPIRVSAVNQAQAVIIAQAMAVKHNWVFQSVGTI